MWPCPPCRIPVLPYSGRRRRPAKTHGAAVRSRVRSAVATKSPINGTLEVPIAEFFREPRKGAAEGRPLRRPVSYHGQLSLPTYERDILRRHYLSSSPPTRAARPLKSLLIGLFVPKVRNWLHPEPLNRGQQVRQGTAHVFDSRACWLISPFFATGVALVGRSQQRSFLCHV
jgi:hypothetical protein